MRLLLTLTVLALLAPAARTADVPLAEGGQAKAVLCVPARLLDDAVKNPEQTTDRSSLAPEPMRRRLRESVRDLAAVLGRISGAKFDVVAGKPTPGDKRLPILVAEFAAEKFGPPKKSAPYKQGCTVVVAKDAVGLYGESDLAASYAVYGFLHQLGCRWYFPGDLGEVLPSRKTLSAAEGRLDDAPYTVCRTIWYCDADYARRNRVGGMTLNAGHNLEFAVPKELRKSNPEIRAVIGGKPHDHFIKWTHPLVADALVNAFLEQKKKDPAILSFSLSPDDGMSWDESDDRKFDAGDFDPSAGVVSKTDRLMVLANRVADRVTAKHPDALFGLLAYVDYFRPPVREKVPASVIPMIAPITYSRAHPMSDDNEPNNKALRQIIEGWAKVSPRISYYFYAWNLAELSGPNPMIAKWGHDVPYVYRKGNCRFWQPETITNFESCLHALYMGTRMAWNPDEKPADIVAELHRDLYGAAAKEMADYWHFIDDVWVKTPEYSGCGFGHLRRWTRGNLTKARTLIDKAAAAAKTDVEKQRIEMASASLALFDDFMKLREDLAAGSFAGLDERAKAYIAQLLKLGAQYEKNFAFGHGLGWAKDRNVNSSYFSAFYEATYKDAARLAKDYRPLTPTVRHFRFNPDKDKTGEKEGWFKSDFDDAKWRKTDVAVDTWSALELHNYMGSAWYRTKVSLDGNKGKKVLLWLGATDGRVKVFVNGRHVTHVGDKGAKADSFTGFCQPTTFDVTQEVGNGKEVTVALFCSREFLNELGTGGLLAPVRFYSEK